jgi:hypothetical protein
MFSAVEEWEALKLENWFMVLKNGKHFTEIKEAVLVKLKNIFGWLLFFDSPNAKKYKKYCLEIILCQNKQSLNVQIKLNKSVYFSNFKYPSIPMNQ